MNVGVLGAGTMGRGIAQVCAMAVPEEMELKKETAAAVEDATGPGRDRFESLLALAYGDRERVRASRTGDRAPLL